MQSTSENKFFAEPHAIYHAWSGQYLSSHLLIAAHESRDEWRERMTKPSEDTVAYAFGRAVHTLCLEGRKAFDEGYVVGGPVNERTGKTYQRKSKKFQEWAATQKKEAVTPEELQLAERMTQMVHKKKAARQLLELGEPELVARTEYCGLPCQIRTDWLAESKWIADLKTTSDMFSFGTSVKQYGYLYQAAFYQAIAKEVTGHLYRYFLIATEKTPEAPCVVWELDQRKLDEHRKENEKKIDEIRDEFLRINANRPDISMIVQEMEERQFYLENTNNE